VTLIGRPVSELPTPALVVDPAIVAENIATMAQWAAGRVGVRPHFKTHKSLAIARQQVAAGAIGITCATVWEAQSLVDGGLDAILVANQVVGPEKVSVIAELSARADITVAVDSAEQAAALSGAVVAAAGRLGVLVEADIGLHRGGVRSVADGIALAAALVELDGLELRGVMGYEGHVVTEPDRDVRRAGAERAIDVLRRHAEGLRALGHRIEIVSAGGTNTRDMTGCDPLVTELQAGTYAVMDSAYAPLAPAFHPALRIHATVVSRHADTAVLDCGTKSLSVELGPPLASVGTVREVHEEHTLLDVDPEAPPRLGDRVELSVVYCGGTINLHDVYYVAEDATVSDVWPIEARGPGGR
jgi:D-serine deaminase-like pyridoxal phosphate-dependent protein